MERDCESELSKLNIEQNACIYHFGASVIHGQRSNILRLLNTGFRHLNPLFKLGKFRDVLKYICLSFVSFLPLFYFCCIYYFGSLIFCCQFVAIKLLCNITSTFQQIISLRELNFYGSHIPSLANVD